MCGIVGILGTHEVSPIILEALRRLEYRGYDSAGIATIEDGTLDLRRAVGKLMNLSDHLVHHPLPGKSGIGHTRWATHGGPTVANAHPHRAGPVAVVHNGIIENFAELKQELGADSSSMQSETDTEVIALLVAAQMRDGADPVAAVRAVLPRLEGAFALAFLFNDHDDLMIGARRGSPLAIGHGEGEAYLGSDAIALAPLTDRLTYLEEGDWCVLTRSRVQIYDSADSPVDRTVTRIETGAAHLDKAGHRHWMAKEIAEQPQVVARVLERYVPGGVPTLPPTCALDGIGRVVLVACGTGHYACMIAKYWIERLAGLPVDVDIASEFRYRQPPIPPGTLAIFVSQSGETADTLAALRHCQGRARIWGIVNVPTSSIAREADAVLPILAGVEVGVASTKAFTAQLTVLAAIAMRLALDRGQDIGAAAADLHRLPALMAQALATETAVESLARKLAEARDILFLGRGAMFPLALEAALKLKEISYIHAEAYAAGELKHGPIALVDDQVPVIVLAPSDPLMPKTLSNAHEVMARAGKVVFIGDAAGIRAAGEGVWSSLQMPACPDLWAPILYAIPAQLLAYHTAIAKGTDVDQPRNLAKSVTVE